MTVDPRILAIQTRAGSASIPMADLHQRTGMPSSTWYRWVNGKVDPRLSLVRKYEEALDELIEERREALAALPERLA